MIKSDNRRILITVDPETESYIDLVKNYLRGLGFRPSNSDVVSFLASRFYRDYLEHK